jgi:hypothetical protein
MKIHLSIKGHNILNVYTSCGLSISMSGLLKHREENELNIVKQWDASSTIKEVTCKRCKQTKSYKIILKNTIVKRLKGE